MKFISIRYLGILLSLSLTACQLSLTHPWARLPKAMPSLAILHEDFHSSLVDHVTRALQSLSIAVLSPENHPQGTLSIWNEHFWIHKLSLGDLNRSQTYQAVYQAMYSYQEQGTAIIPQTTVQMTQLIVTAPGESIEMTGKRFEAKEHLEQEITHRILWHLSQALVPPQEERSPALSHNVAQ